MSDTRKSVYLPLENLDKCAQCEKSTDLRLCSSCGERIYCSEKCQKADWSAHKLNCGQTHRIGLESFYPLLACLTNLCRYNTLVHSALMKAIINDPNPGCPPTEYAGAAANMIILDDDIPDSEIGEAAWWPTAISNNVRTKLFLRILYEGQVAHLVSAICLALLSQMYTTTYESLDGKQKQRIRLRYHSSPIADFGISCGSVDVEPQDMLAYIASDGLHFTKGQNPDDHYWIYFTTLSGEEVTLDCSLFTFNMCVQVPDGPYVPFDSDEPCFAPGKVGPAPAVFRDKKLNPNTTPIYTERKKVSVLRNTDLHRAVMHGDDQFSTYGAEILFDFMEDLIERKMPYNMEKDMMIGFYDITSKGLGHTLKSSRWKTFPLHPQVGYDGDPGEMDGMDDEDKPDGWWWKYMKKRNRLRKEEVVTAEEFLRTFPPFSKIASNQNMPDTRECLKTVYLPLEKLDKCAQCEKSTDLRLCSSCGERIYCSGKCQKADWPAHKPNCGKTHRIGLESFYPLLACLAQLCRYNTFMHPALAHAIINDPNPGCLATELPDGSAAKLIVLGEDIPDSEVGSAAWWPTAISDNVRRKLYLRILCDGRVAHLVSAICLALLSQIYTTTSESLDGKQAHRIRLRYHSSPITDFGISCGSVDVEEQDMLAYFSSDALEFMKGQNPDDHYWIYFTTLSGEEVTLDISMFTFNFCLNVPDGPYIPFDSTEPYFRPGGCGLAPAVFRDKKLNRDNIIHFRTERRKVSILRNTDLHRAIRHGNDRFATHGAQILFDFMENLTGRKMVHRAEKDLMIKFYDITSNALENTLKTSRWKTFPLYPEIWNYPDPGEPGGKDDVPDGWGKHMKKWNRLHKGGKVTREEYLEAFCAFSDQARTTR